MTLEARWTTVDGLRIHSFASVDHPDGAPTVVLVHGMGSSRYLRPAAQALARSCRVLAPDLPGFGRSQAAHPPLGVPELADVLAGWMAAVGVERATVVGHSAGCQVVADLAARHPERVAAVVLAGPTGDPRGHTLPRYAGRLLRTQVHEPPSFNLVVARDALYHGPFMPLRVFLRFLRDHPAEKVPRITVPLVVVRGRRDRIAPARWVDELTALAPAGRAVTLPGAHTVVYSSPDALAEVVADAATAATAEKAAWRAW